MLTKEDLVLIKKMFESTKTEVVTDAVRIATSKLEDQIDKSVSKGVTGTLIKVITANLTREVTELVMVGVTAKIDSMLQKHVDELSELITTGFKRMDEK